MITPTSPKVTFPVISPTGALASGDYVNYMLTYDQALANFVQQQLMNCYSADQINDWNLLWTRILNDVQSQVTDLNERTSKIAAQITMLSGVLKK